MSSVTFGCPKCGRGIERESGESAPCRHCGEVVAIGMETPPPCLICGCDEIYRHRDFNQKLGIAIIAVGVTLWIWLETFLPMIGAAVLDLLLFYRVADVAICYRCKAHYRGFTDVGVLSGFDLERHEHFRWEAAANKEGSTDAPSGASSTGQPERSED